MSQNEITMPLEKDALQNVRMQRREIVASVEKEMREREQVEIAAFHYFAKGLHAREVRIPAGILCTGKIHKHEHLNILMQGKIRITSEDIDTIIEAPATLIAFPGTKNLIYAIEESVFMNVVATDLTNIEEIDKEFFTEDYDDLQIEEQPCSNRVVGMKTIRLSGKIKDDVLYEISSMMSMYKNEIEPDKASLNIASYISYMKYMIENAFVYYLPQKGFCIIHKSHDPLLSKEHQDFYVLSNIYIVPDMRKTRAYYDLFYSSIKNHDGQIIGLTYQESENNAVLSKRFKKLGTIYGRG